jgi:hypothetical protein
MVRLGGQELGVTPLDVERDAAAGSASLELGQDGRFRTLREVALDKDLDLEVGVETPAPAEITPKSGKKPAHLASPRPHRPPTTPTKPQNPPQDLEIRGRR